MDHIDRQVQWLESLICQPNEEIPRVSNASFNTEAISRTLPASSSDEEGTQQVITKVPNLPIFSGKDPSVKLESTFEQWILDVSLVRYNYPKHLLREAIGKSLREHATDIAHC